MKRTLLPIELRLSSVWKVSRESFRTCAGLIVMLEEDGLIGLGEAAVFMVARYDSSLESMTRALRAVEPELSSRRLDDPEELWHALQPWLAGNPFAQCALDVAAWDLWAKKKNAPLHRLWGLDPARAPLTDYSLGMDTIEVMEQKLAARPEWPSYKIKVGSAQDIEVLRSLRTRTTSPFRVDANCGWTAAETLEKAAALVALGVESIEQPLPVEAWDDMARLRALSPLPLIADESCCALADLERCASHFHGVNIKLMKCGGITPARHMIARARELGLRVMIGCMPESSVGISAIAQLAPLLDEIDVDSILLIDNDPARGVTIDQGRLVYPERPGCGAELL